MEHLVIEPLTPQYLEQTAQLHRTILPFPLTDRQARAGLERMQNSTGHCVLLARQGEQVLGTVTLIFCQALAGTFLVLEDFVVRPGLTGQGIGSRLMEQADRLAHREGCEYAILVSSDFRKDAHRFYRRHGFVDGVVGFRKIYNTPVCGGEEDS